LKSAPAKELAGGEPGDNAEMVRSLLKGEKGPRRDVVLLNAAAAFLAAGAVKDFREGIEKAAHSIDSGGAARTLDRIIEVSNA
jgi:anthranilate phosphoribosyltransferase